MATNVICSRCGKPYLAYSSRSTIDYKLRQGNPLALLIGKESNSMNMEGIECSARYAMNA